MSRLVVAAIQMNSISDKAHNVARAMTLCEAAIAQGAKVVALPEVFNYRAFVIRHDRAEPIPGPSLQPLMQLAKTKSVWIIVGSLAEAATIPEKMHNTSVVISPEGICVAQYRKLHLFDSALPTATIRESRSFIAGTRPVWVDIAGIKTGLSICYDLRFPELYRYYSHMGAQLLSVPASFMAVTGQAHWHVLLRARAIENYCFVIAPNQVGVGAQNSPTFGHSLIIDPWGEVLAEGSPDQEEVLVATLDFDRLNAVRTQLPSLSHRRTLADFQ